MSIFHFVRLFVRATKYRTHKDPHELRALLAAVGEGDTVVDIGAHKGAYSYWLAKAVGPRGKVIAFEPQPRLAARLMDVFTWRGWLHVCVEQKGLSSKPGVFTLFRPGAADSPGATLNSELHAEPGSTVQVMVDTLDDYLERFNVKRVAAIKIDVEGHELQVFEGGRRVLERDRPLLMFECEARHHTQGRMEDVFRYLEGLGYEGHFFHEGVVRPLSEFDAAKHQRVGEKPYVNNFLFRASSVSVSAPARVAG